MSDQPSNMNRRRFLQVAGSTVVGAAGLVALGGTGSTAPNEATPNTRVKVKDSFNYKGQKVELVEMNETEMLHLNGQPMPDHVFTKTNNGYASHLMPYDDYKKPRDLAKKLIDENGTLFVLPTEMVH